MGGFLIWVTAIAILAPLNLGGFEVLGPAGGDSTRRDLSQIAHVADAAVRLRRYAMQLLPIYASLTLALWVGLLILGDAPLVAICHAMSVMATSGISPGRRAAGAGSGIGGEALIFLFFVFALSRQTFARRYARPWPPAPAARSRNADGPVHRHFGAGCCCSCATGWAPSRLTPR